MQQADVDIAGIITRLFLALDVANCSSICANVWVANGITYRAFNLQLGA